MNRRSLRLKSYDYSHDGFYFVTICVEDMRCILGEIRNSKVVLNTTGSMVEKSWRELPQKFPFCKLDAYVVMPNHFHGILIFNNNLGVSQAPFSIKKFNGTSPQSLGRIIQTFKSLSSKEYIKILKMEKKPYSKLWHRNYFEKVIKHHVSLANIRKYITENPLKWESDEYNHSKIDHQTKRANSRFAPTVIK